MSDRSRLLVTRRIAVAGFLITLVSFFYITYKSRQTDRRMAVLERVNAVKDSIRLVAEKRMDSIQDLKFYKKTLQAYEKSANQLFTQNQNLPGSGSQFLTIANKCDSTVEFAVTFLGINKTWFTEGFLSLKPEETTKIWAVDSLSTVYVYVKGDALINGDQQTTLKEVNLSVDTNNSFIFTGIIPPPHKTAVRTIFREVNESDGNKIVFSDQ
jgi:hypothetical protein